VAAARIVLTPIVIAPAANLAEADVATMMLGAEHMIAGNTVDA